MDFKLKDETLKGFSNNTDIPVEKLDDIMPEDELEHFKSKGIIVEYPNGRLNGLKLITPKELENLDNKLLGRKYKRAMKKHRREKAREARKADSESSL
jgi:hypothetical protein